MSGQAEASSIGDLANFLDGQAESPVEDENEQSEDLQDDMPDSTSDEAQDEDQSDSEDDDNAEDQATGELFDVTIKSEDGETITEKVDRKTLVEGYMRTKDYTQKTMKLAETERQVISVAQQKIDEGRNYFISQAELAKQLVTQLAGLKDQNEMYRLSVEDPTAWVHEQERMRSITAAVSELDAAIAAQNQFKETQKKEAEQRQISEAWKVLNEKGIDHGKLSAIYTSVSKDYGVPMEAFSTILHPGLALALKDAAAYRELQNKKPQIQNKVKESGTLPNQKKALPQQERVNRKAEEKFRGGKAKVNDLASFLSRNGM